MLSALILAATVQRPQTVSFTHPCAHSSIVLEALGEELGLTMEPSGSVNDDYFLLRFDDVVVQDALDKIAETLIATWTIKEGVYFLGRTAAQTKQGDQQGREWIKESVEEYLTSAKRTHIWTSNEAVERLRRHIQTDGNFNREAFDNAIAANGPFRELLDEFVRTVGAKELSQLPYNRTTTYRWNTTNNDRKIPASLRTPANQTVSSVKNFSQAFQGLGVPAPTGWDPVRIAEIAKARRFSREVWSFSVLPMGTWLYVYVAGFGAVSAWSSSIIIRASSAPEEISAIEGLETPIVQSPFAEAITTRLVQAATGTGHRLGERDNHAEEIMDWFENGLVTDPLSYLGGESLLQISEESGYNIVAVLPDSLSSGIDVSQYARNTLRDWLVHLSGKMILEVDTASKWISLKPISQQGGDERFDRAKAAQFAMRTYEKGWSTIDELADLTKGCDGIYAFNFARGLSDVLQPVRRVGVRMIDPALFRSLELYASLPSAARQTAKDSGLKLPLSALPGPTRVCLNESVAFMDLHEPKEDLSGLSWPFELMTGTRNAVRKPVRLPADAVLEIRVEAARLFANPDTKGGGGLAPGSLMTAKEAAQRVYWALEPNAPPAYSEQYTNLAVVFAERLVIVLSLPDGTVLETKITTDARSPETTYLPIAALNGPEANQFKEELRQLKGGSGF